MIVPSGPRNSHPAVDGVGHRADAVRVRGDARRRVELALRAAGRPERAQQPPVEVEDVDAVVARVGDVDVARAVRRDPAHERELARSAAVGAPAGLVRVAGRRGAEAQDPVVQVVGDEDPPRGVDRDAVREVELARPGARPAEAADDLAARVRHEDAVALVVGDVEPRALHREALRVRERAGREDHRRLRALHREALDAVVARVGDVQAGRSTSRGRRPRPRRCRGRRRRGTGRCRCRWTPRSSGASRPGGSGRCGCGRRRR